MEPNYTLYILMRTDMESLNPGKAMAQASHAYGAAKMAIRKNTNLQKAFLQWMDQTEQEFGKTIVLGAEGWQITSVLADIDYHKLAAGWVHDPTYPIRDGLVTHFIPLDTCAFVFGDANDASDFLSHLKLHP